MSTNFYEGHKSQLTFDPKTRRTINVSGRKYDSGKPLSQSTVLIAQKERA